MAIYKNKDITTNINERGVDLGDINVNFYTEDNGTASIRIKIKNQQGMPINFNNTDMLPRLDLYAKDGSIFTNELVDIVLPEQGLIQYKVPDYVIRHEGKMDCKLFLENGTESVHVANFYFVIKDSGITGAIGKEIKVEVLEDMVGKVLLDNAETFRADPIETAEHLKPTLINSAKEEFERLSTAKQVDSEVINARGDFDNLNQRLNDSDDKVSNTQRVINIVARGAIGDGTTDNYQIIQDAITEAEIDGSSIFIPSGNFYISKNLETKHMTSYNYRFGIKIFGNGKDSILTRKSGKIPADYTSKEKLPH